MFTLIPGLAPFTVGVTARGKIIKKDYTDVLLPALKKVSAEWKGINMLLVMETDMKNFTLNAWLEDIKVNANYFFKWNKMAIVTDGSVLDKITAVFGTIVPGEAKAFSLDEVEQAKEWVNTP